MHANDGIGSFQGEGTIRGETLQESERRLRALVTASSDAVYRMNADWSVMYQLRRNMEERSFLANTEDPDSNWLQRYIHPEDQTRVLAAISKAISEKSIFDLEHRVLQVDGSLGWTHSRAVPILDEQGDIKEWFGMASDVTEQKRAMELLIRNEKLAATGRLAASIAHEVNNPLESVTNLLYLARTTDDLRDIREFLEAADQELARAVTITTQTLRFYKQTTAPKPVTASELIHSLLLLHRGRLAAAKVCVEESLRANYAVSCYESEIRQVLSNLISNATDAMRPQGGRLLVRSRDGRRWKTGERGLVITVADTGSGMSAQTQEKLYEAFYTTKGMEGTGLGLWVSREIVTRYRGELRLRSSQTPGKSGTVFSLFLPYNAVQQQN